MNFTTVLQEPEAIYGNTEISTVVSLQDEAMRGHNTSIYLSKPGFFSPEIAALLQKLRRLSKMEENWDSYGAEAPSSIAIQTAMDFIVDNHFLDLPFYFTAPGVNGEIILEFSKEDKASEIYFNPDGSTELILFKNNESQLEGTLDENFQDLINFFND